MVLSLRGVAGGLRPRCVQAPPSWSTNLNKVRCKTVDPIGITLRFSNYSFRGLIALLCVGLVLPGDTWAWAAQQEAPAPEAVKLSNDQLDSLVAPIALYPDPMLAQVLAASTYPL